jgi:hypothetical protein
VEDLCVVPDSTTGTTGETTGDGSGSTTGQPAGPMIENFQASVTSITEGDSVTFTATIVDPDGPSDVVSATMTSTDTMAVFGELTSDGDEVFSLTLSWEDLHAVEPITFYDDVIWSFTLTATDSTDLSNVAMTTLKLTCSVQDACDGVCVDTLTSNEHCGTCGTTCNVDGGGGCADGTCAAALHDCIDNTVTDCEQYCASVGETCVQGGCDTATYVIYDDDQTCADYTAAVAQGTACNQAINWNLNMGSNVARCCCTDGA